MQAGAEPQKKVGCAQPRQGSPRKRFQIRRASDEARWYQVPLYGKTKAVDGCVLTRVVYDTGTLLVEDVVLHTHES